MHSALHVAYHAREGTPNGIDARCANNSMFKRMAAGPASAMGFFADDTHLDAELIADCEDAWAIGVLAWALGSDARHAFAWFTFWAALPWIALVVVLVVGGWCVCRRVAPPLSAAKTLSAALGSREAAFDMLPLRGRQK